MVGRVVPLQIQGSSWSFSLYGGSSMNQCLKAAYATQKGQCTPWVLAWARVVTSRAKLQSNSQVVGWRYNSSWPRWTLWQDLLLHKCWGWYKTGYLHRVGQGCLGVSWGGKESPGVSTEGFSVILTPGWHGCGGQLQGTGEKEEMGWQMRKWKEAAVTKWASNVQILS